MRKLIGEMFVKKCKCVISMSLAFVMGISIVTSGLGVSAYADEFDGYLDDEPEGPQDPSAVPESWYEEPQDLPGPQDFDYYGYLVLSCNNQNLTTGAATSAHADIYTNTYGCEMDVMWDSSDWSVASVDSAGNDITIRANGAGSAYISATLYIEGDIFDRDGFYINVTDPAPTYISVNGIQIGSTSMTLNAGESRGLSASVTPSNANNKGISYSSNNDSVAWVGADGVVHANAEGNCVITARTDENGYCAYCNVAVNGTVKKNLPVSGVKIDPSNVSMMVNQTVTIGATVFPLGASNSQVLWDSSNPAVAVVDAYGNVTAKSVGTTNINCTTVDGGFRTYSVITVVPATANHIKQGTVVASKTRSADLNFKVATEIMNAKKNATVTIVSPSPMSYDKTVATLLASRPDIKLQCTFPFNGYVFTLTLPKKYDLSKQLDKTGYVEWIDLCTKKGVDVKMVKK